MGFRFPQAPLLVPVFVYYLAITFMERHVLI